MYFQKCYPAGAPLNLPLLVLTTLREFFFFFLLSLKISFFIVYLHQLQVAGFLWVGHVTLSSCFIENRINCQSGTYDILHYLSIFNIVGSFSMCQEVILFCHLNNFSFFFYFCSHFKFLAKILNWVMGTSAYIFFSSFFNFTVSEIDFIMTFGQ